MCLVGLTTAAGQLSSMPPEGSLPRQMVSHFDFGTFALVMDRESLGGLESQIRLTFKNDQPPYSLDFRWAASSDVGEQQLMAPTVETSEPVSFLPTAVCREATTGDVIFVAGWDRQSRTCVIEKWTLGPGIFLASPNPATGEPEMAYSPPTIDRAVVYESRSGIAAVESMAFHPISQTLMILEYGPSSNLLLLDLAGTLTHLADANVLPELRAAAQVSMGSHTSLPYGAFIKPVRAWSASPAKSLLVIPDANGDGVYELENVLRLDQRALAAKYPPGGWNPVR